MMEKIIDQSFQSAIDYSLEYHLYDNAIFLSERWYGWMKHTMAFYYRVLAYYQGGHKAMCYKVIQMREPWGLENTKEKKWRDDDDGSRSLGYALKDVNRIRGKELKGGGTIAMGEKEEAEGENEDVYSPEYTVRYGLKIRYLYATCCYDLGYWQEGEKVLRDEIHAWEKENTLDPTILKSLQRKTWEDHQSAWYCLLGMICRKSNRTDQSVESLTLSLRQNPWLWTAYATLCEQGSSLEASEIFDKTMVWDRAEDDSFEREFMMEVKPEFTSPLSHGEENMEDDPCPKQSEDEEKEDDMDKDGKKGTGSMMHRNSPLISHSMDSPKFAPRSVANMAFNSPYQSPALQNLQDKLNTIKKNQELRSLRKPLPKLLDDDSLESAVGLRRSNRMNYGSIEKRSPTEKGDRKRAHSSILKTQIGKKNLNTGSFINFFSQTPEYSDKKQNPLLPFTKNATQEIIELFCKLGNAYRLLCSYQCTEAIALFSELSMDQFHTGWVLSNVCKAYFELIDYDEAFHYFEMMRQIEPFRMEGMEVFSTVLWHLKKEVSLSHLAHELMQLDKTGPEAWCAAGNCFSLKKDHESALKCFQHALEIDSNFTYAHTLCGHEHFANDDLDKAQQCFRTALRTDTRHYNAWYGLGMIYYRQEKYEIAYFHFKKALEINPHCSVLYCYIGMVLHAMKKPQEALLVLERASKLDDKNPIVRFKKAQVFVALERYKDALQELQRLKEVAPRESAIYFLMGQIYKKTGEKDKAMMHFTWAYDLDPKGSCVIKEALDKHSMQEDDVMADELRRE